MAGAQEPLVTYDRRPVPTARRTSTARRRWEKLEQRYRLARAHATLEARGEYDDARHGAAVAETLTRAEHLERLALGEYLSGVQAASEVGDALAPERPGPRSLPPWA